MSDEFAYRKLLLKVAEANARFVLKKDTEYGGSWKKRGGHSAAENIMRKVDRLVVQLEAHGWDIFKALQDKSTSESLIDTMRDLSAYLLLVEAEMIVQGVVASVKQQPIARTEQKNPFGYDQQLEDYPEREI